ncbi:MAG: rod shape-determining protein MreC, partial [Elusimicrobia bacterium]|nr:rod shape-determining protein MreC [Elusimicrobiota bacterium]
MSLPLSGPVQSFKACVSYLLHPIAFHGDRGVEKLGNVPARMRSLILADVDNERLKEELRQDAWIKAEIESLRIENERLRSALAIKALVSGTPIWARVMERDALHWHRHLIVNAGADRGISANAPVLAHDGGRFVAIGRVTEVRERLSIVLLLTDELSSVAAYVTSPSTEVARSVEGLLQGQG